MQSWSVSGKGCKFDHGGVLVLFIDKDSQVQVCVLEWDGARRQHAVDVCVAQQQPVQLCPILYCIVAYRDHPDALAEKLENRSATTHDGCRDVVYGKLDGIGSDGKVRAEHTTKLFCILVCSNQVRDRTVRRCCEPVCIGKRKNDNDRTSRHVARLANVYCVQVEHVRVYVYF
jgi:hypothetical protein